MGGSGGTSSAATMDLSFLGSKGFGSAASRQTTPMRFIGPSGTTTNIPGASASPSGTA